MAISIMLRDDFQQTDKNKLLEQWERTTFRIYGLLDNDARTKVGDYVRISKIIYNDKSTTVNKLVKMIAEIGQEFSIDKAVEVLRTKDCYTNWHRKLRYFFYRYEESIAEKTKNQIDEITWNIIWKNNLNETIEHILPRDKNKQCWSSIFDDTHHKELINTIGNLCLLSQPLNSEARNFCFATKLDIYRKTNLLSNKEIMNLENGTGRTEWKVADINARTENLLIFASEQWKDLQ